MYVPLEISHIREQLMYLTKVALFAQHRAVISISNINSQTFIILQLVCKFRYKFFMSQNETSDTN